MLLVQIVTYLIRGAIPLFVLLLTYFCIGFDTVLGRVFITASSAILLHFLIDIGLGVCLNENQEPEPFPTTQTEAVKFTINAVIVVTGVLLGFLSNQNTSSLTVDNINNINWIAFGSCGLGIFFGLINISLFTSGIESEYSYTIQNGPNQPQKTLHEVKMKPVIYLAVTLLLNLQFICLLVGIAATAFLHI